MRRPAEPPENTEAHQSPGLPPAPKPFNIFEGLPQEPLPPAQGPLNSIQPTAASQKQDNLSNTNEPVVRVPAIDPQRSRRSSYILIAIIALVLGVIIGIALK